VLKPDGLQRTIFSLALTKPASLYVSCPILDEYREVHLSRLKISGVLQRQTLDLITDRGKIVAPVRRLSVTRDPDDNIFVERADAGPSGLSAHRQSTPIFQISGRVLKIVTAREFMELVVPHLMRQLGRWRP